MNEQSITIQQNDNEISDNKTTTFVATRFEGPLPAPEILYGYEQTLPGLADRITKMAENQAFHRQGIERKLVGGDSNRAYMGLIFAFIIVIVGIGAGVYLISKDKPVSGFITLFTPLGIMVAAFMSQKKKKE